MTDKRRFPDPQELAIFLEVAKQRSFSQAALRLGVTTITRASQFNRPVSPVHECRVKTLLEMRD